MYQIYSPMNPFLRRTLLLIVTLSPLWPLNAQNTPSAPPQEGLVAWYPFNGNTEDATINSNNGSFHGSQLSLDRAGNANSAIMQNGNPSYLRTKSVINNVSNDFSISFWVYPLKNDIVKTQGISGLEGYGTMPVIHAAHGGNWGTASSNAGVGVNVGINQIQVVEHTHLFIASPLVYPCNLVGWNHITVVYRDHIPSLYLNGEFVKQGLKSSITNVRPSNGFCSWYSESGFGRSFSPNGNPIGQFNGSYDEIMIYNRPLSDNEVMQLYSSSNTPPSNILLSNNIISENLPIAYELGTLSSIDIEGGSITYELVTGFGDNSKFFIEGNTLRSSITFDYETQSTYTIKIKASDTGGLSFEKSFNISIQDVPIETIPLDGLVAWYPFNGNANDESGNGNNGSINGEVALTIDRNGNSNKAYLFNGNINSYINIPMSNSLRIKNQITITAWIYMEGGYYNPRVLSNELSGYDHYYMSVAGTSNISRKLEAGLNGIAGSSGFCCGGINGIDVSAKSWHFIAFTVGSDGLSKLYLDGKLVKSLQGNVVNNLNYGPNLNIGRNSYPAYDAWGGKLDDIGIWNRGLNSVEISQIYTSVIQSQQISFSTIGDKYETLGSFSLSATTTSGLPVTFTTEDLDKITILENTVTIVKPGSVTIKAKQDGNINFSSAESVSQTICILPKKPSITANGLDSENTILTSSSTSNNFWYRNNIELPGATNNTYIVDGKGLYTVKVTVDGCSSEFSDPYAIIITDAIDSENSIRLSLHPNPSSYELKIILRGVKQDETSEMVIYDLAGRVMCKEIIKGNESLLTIDKYPSGNYLMQITNRSFLLNTRFVKQ